MKIGAVIDGQYRIERALSERPDSVFSARRASDGVEVVVKVLPANLGGQRLISRLARAQSIKSAYAARYLAIGNLPDQRPFIVMERLSGPTLAERLRRGRLDVAEAVDCIVEACDAVAAAHAAGLIHRNLTTENLMLDDSGGHPVVKVLGFVNRVRPPSNEDAPGAPADGAAIEYLAPEQITHPARVDRRCDQWALAVILFELLTRKLPFSAMTRKALLRRIVDDAPAAPRSIRADVPWPLEQAILRTLEKSPGQRWETIADLAQTIAPFGTARTAPLPARIAEVCAPMRKSRAPAAADSAAATSAARVTDTLTTLTPPRSSVEEDGEIGFRRITSDGRIEALDPDAAARLTRAHRVAESADALAREAEANPPPPDVDAPEFDTRDDNIRSLSPAPRASGAPSPAGALPLADAGQTAAVPTGSRATSTAADAGAPVSARPTEARKRAKRRARRKADLVRAAIAVAVAALLVGVLVGLAIVVGRR